MKNDHPLCRCSVGIIVSVSVLLIIRDPAITVLCKPASQISRQLKASDSA